MTKKQLLQSLTASPSSMHCSLAIRCVSTGLFSVSQSLPAITYLSKYWLHYLSILNKKSITTYRISICTHTHVSYMYAAWRFQPSYAQFGTKRVRYMRFRYTDLQKLSVSVRQGDFGIGQVRYMAFPEFVSNFRYVALFEAGASQRPNFALKHSR